MLNSALLICHLHPEVIMRAYTWSLGLVTSASANIMFNHVPLSCDLFSNENLYNGCLEGQICTDEKT